MTIIFDILKFFAVLVYVFFLLDATLNIKYNSEEENLSWLDLVYLAYSGLNFVLIIKILHG